MIGLIFVAIHGVLMLGVMTLTYDYFDNIPADYVHMVEAIKIPVYFGVFGISVLWALGHALFGGIIGMTTGSVMDGVKLALILGTANSVGRLWPYIATFSVGAFLNSAPNWIVIVSFLVALICFGIYMFMSFIRDA